MAGVAGTVPNKISGIMVSVASLAICVTIKAAWTCRGENCVNYRSIRSLHVHGSSGLMTFGTAKLMQGQNTIRATPGVGEHRVGAACAASTMTGITGGAIGEIRTFHDHHMGVGTKMSIKIRCMTLGTWMRFETYSGIGCRTDKHPTANATLMTVRTSAAMDTGNDLAIRCVHAGSAYSVTTLTRANPSEGTITFRMQSMDRQPVIVTILTTNRYPTGNDILNRGVARADVRGSGGIMTLATAKLMQGQNAIGSGPAIGEQRIQGGRSAYLMTVVTG